MELGEFIPVLLVRFIVSMGIYEGCRKGKCII